MSHPRNLTGRPPASLAPESQNLRYAGLTIMRDHQIFDKEVETRPVAAQQQLDKSSYQEQIAYLMKHSVFYQEKLLAAGFSTPEQVGGLGDIAQLRLARFVMPRQGRTGRAAEV